MKKAFLHLSPFTLHPSPFTPTVDRFMAVRLLTYTGLLYQYLIKSGQVKGKQKLPPVFPLVLYKWRKTLERSHQHS